MTIVSSLTGRPVCRSSINSRLAERVETGSELPSAGQREQALCQPDDRRPPVAPRKQEKHEFVARRSASARRQKVCRSPLATPPGTETSTEVPACPFRRSET